MGAGSTGEESGTPMSYGEAQPFVYPAIADHLYEITAGLRSRTDQAPGSGRPGRPGRVVRGMSGPSAGA